MSDPVQPIHAQVSQLVLSDRLLALAREAERAGFGFAARRLLNLAHCVFDETPGVTGGGSRPAA